MLLAASARLWPRTWTSALAGPRPVSGTAMEPTLQPAKRQKTGAASLAWPISMVFDGSLLSASDQAWS
jgi:hypothetical protein